MTEIEELANEILDAMMDVNKKYKIYGFYNDSNNHYMAEGSLDYCLGQLDADERHFGHAIILNNIVIYSTSKHIKRFDRIS